MGISISTAAVLPPMPRSKTTRYPMSTIEIPLSDGQTEGITY